MYATRRITFNFTFTISEILYKKKVKVNKKIEIFTKELKLNTLSMLGVGERMKYFKRIILMYTRLNICMNVNR